ncbi:MAG: lamin tail domain-containing protein, partial [Nanoarchaeota archaeon]|nr:lamin tail domain-containing protein [Nanoarchaeota archaeon]
ILFLLLPFKALADSGHIVISEIMTYGQTSKDEFVRLYNPTGSAIDISGWKLKKKTSSGSESNLVSGFPEESIIPANSGFLITHKTDYVGAESADATWSGASYSIADNNTILLYNNEEILIDKVGFGTATDFESEPTENPTEGASILRQNNQDTDNNKNDFISTASAEEEQTPSSESSSPETTASASFGDIIINEIVSDPDEGKEWIEFYNTTSNIINIEGWEVYDGSNKIYTLLGVIYPNSFITIEINNRLNNSGDAIYLSDANNFSIAQLIYGDWNGSMIEAPKKGESIARETNGSYKITTILTKNYENQFLEEQETVEIQKITSNNFYQSDINIIEQFITVNEILPNPEGSDTTGEWIELYNSGDEDINLGGIYLDDMEGGSNPYKIPNDTIIKASGYLLFPYNKTKLSLNNTNDSARILDQDKNEIINIEYDDAKEGLSYALLDDDWQWTSSPTPLAENIKTKKQENIKTTSTSSAAQNSATGIVIVPPNIFNTQTMYINGLQLYMFYADWPALEIGDKITVWGEPSTYYGEPRLKLKGKNSIQTLSHNNSLEPLALTSSNIDDEAVGNFVSAEGEIIESSSKKISIYIDGSELLIYNKTSIDFSGIKERDIIKITGVLSKYNDEYRLLPRNEDDIQLISQGIIEKSEAAKDISPFWQYFASTLAISGIFGTIYLKRRKNDRTTKTGTAQRVEQREEAPF